MIEFIYATIPSVVILLIIYANDKFKEPKVIIFKTFLLGYALSFFLYPFIFNLDDLIESIYQNSYTLSYLDYDFISNFLRASFLEESAKFIILYIFVSKYSEFDEPMDAIVYGVAVSLGFSAMENFDYIRTEEELTLLQISLHRFLPTMMHMTTGIMMGFLFSKFYFNHTKKFWKLFIALFIPLLVHGTYNFSWVWGMINFNSFIYSYLLLVFIIFVAVLMFRHQKSKQISIQENNILTFDNYSLLAATIISNLITVIFLCVVLTAIFF